MAQAPDAPGGGGAPRQNKTVKQFSGMNTQNERNAIPEGSFHWLENIQPIGPGNLHSIPGRGQSLTRIPPNPPPPPGCTDTTDRGQQLITIETAFDQATTFGGGNLRTSWGQVVNGELYSLIGQSFCAGGNMAYTNTCCQINHYKNDNPALFEAILLPTTDPLASFVNTRIGTADQFVWAAGSSGFGGVRIYFGLGNSFVDYQPPAYGGSHDLANFAILGNSVWAFHAGNGTAAHFIEFNLAGLLLNDYAPWGADVVNVSNMQLTADFLYCIGSFAGETKIYKIDRTNGSIAASFDITQISGNFVAVADDNLIYVLCSGVPAAVYYIKNFTDLIYVGKTIGAGFSPFGFGTGIWNNGKIYYGSNGFSGFNTDVFKIAIACPAETSPPTAPIIAGITRADDTVAAGSPIVVDWTDILLPDATDAIELRAAPTAGDLGFVGAALASMSTGALANGSVSFTIPALTTPGDYIFNLVTNHGAGSILIATSAQFTVT
jgi:hypothetical protein